MRFLKNVFSQLHTFVLWALLSAIFWSWIFTLVTDVSPEKKISVYCYVPSISDVELSARLEEEKPEGIEMVKIRSFEYVMFNVDYIENGDIFIIPESMISEYDELLLDPDGGIKIYDCAEKRGSADSFIGYSDEDYYLFFGANSLHLEDESAKKVAELLIGLD